NVVVKEPPSAVTIAFAERASGGDAAARVIKHPSPVGVVVRESPSGHHRTIGVRALPVARARAKRTLAEKLSRLIFACPRTFHVSVLPIARRDDRIKL